MLRLPIEFRTKPPGNYNSSAPGVEMSLLNAAHTIATWSTSYAKTEGGSADAPDGEERVPATVAALGREPGSDPQK
jgi:hypothetical protein